MVAETQHLIGATALWNIERMAVVVRITDVRQVWGEIQVQISPEEGFGGKWVSFASVREVEPDPAWWPK